MLQKALLVGAGTVVGGGSIYWYMKRSQPAARVISVPAGVTPAGQTAGPPLPHTLVMPAGSKMLSPRQAELLKFGIPNSTQLQLKENYVSLIDYRLREPVWVMEHLTKANLQGKADRMNIPFASDKDVPGMFRASNDDYHRSGYSRGHMAPASNNKGSRESMKESFLLTSNIVPQDLDNNMFYWNRMERWVRNLVTKKGFDDVHVLSGPLFLPSRTSPHGTIVPVANSPCANDAANAMVPAGAPASPTMMHSALTTTPPADIFNAPPCPPSSPQSSMNPGKPFGFVSYKTIGEQNVAVPTHLFKAVLAQKSNGPGKPPTMFFASFVVPNTPIVEHLPLRVFQVSRETLEKYAGFGIYDRAFQTLPVLDLCAVKDPAAARGSDGTMCALESAGEFRLFSLERDLDKAKSREQLDRMLQTAKTTAAKHGVPLPSSFQSIYERKARELQ